MNLYKISVILLLSSSMHAMHKQVTPMNSASASSSSSSSSTAQELHGLFPAGIAGAIDMDSLDPLTKKMHRQQAAGVHNAGLPYVVAGVITQNPRSKFTACFRKNSPADTKYYCEAQALLNIFKDSPLKEQTDPVFHQIMDTVEFCMVSPAEKIFYPLGSSSDLEKNPEKYRFVRAFIEANRGLVAGTDERKEAWEKVGESYINGNVIDKSTAESLPFLKALAAQNYHSKAAACAQYNLAGFYYTGIGVSKNIEEAARLYEIVAEQTHDRSLATEAMYQLCMICLGEEIGNAKNQKEALTVLGYLQVQDYNSDVAQRAAVTLLSLFILSEINS